MQPFTALVVAPINEDIMKDVSMKDSHLPKEATILESCNWLELQTGKSWTLTQLLECGLMPWFWLDYQQGWPDVLFGGRIEGYLAPVVFNGDIQRLSADRWEVLVSMTRTHGGKLIKIDSPALRFSVDELRFLSEDLKELAVNQAEALPIAQTDTTPTKVNKLNRNELDPAIDEAIKQAGNMELADVFLKLKELAINGTLPFTGLIERDALCYTNSDDERDKITKNALGKRLRIRRNNAV